MSGSPIWKLETKQRVNNLSRLLTNRMSATHSQVPAIEGQSQIDTQEQSWPEDRDEVEGGDAEEPLAFEAEEEGDASQGHEEGLLNEDGDEDAGEDVLANEADVAEVSKATKKKRERKAPVPLGREQGKSFYPMSRVQKIIKADKVRVLLLFAPISASNSRMP